MINIAYISGKVLNDMDLKFIYDNKRKSISKIHTSVVELIIELDNKNIVYAKAYDKLADYAYRNIKKYDIIMLGGKVRHDCFEIIQIT